MAQAQLNSEMSKNVLGNESGYATEEEEIKILLVKPKQENIEQPPVNNNNKTHPAPGGAPVRSLEGQRREPYGWQQGPVGFFMARYLLEELGVAVTPQPDSIHVSMYAFNPSTGAHDPVEYTGFMKSAGPPIWIVNETSACTPFVAPCGLGHRAVNGDKSTFRLMSADRTQTSGLFLINTETNTQKVLFPRVATSSEILPAVIRRHPWPCPQTTLPAGISYSAQVDKTGTNTMASTIESSNRWLKQLPFEEAAKEIASCYQNPCCAVLAININTHVALEEGDHGLYYMISGSPLVRKMKEIQKFRPGMLLIEYSMTAVSKILRSVYKSEFKRYPVFITSIFNSSFVAKSNVKQSSLKNYFFQQFNDRGVNYCAVVNLTGRTKTAY